MAKFCLWPKFAYGQILPMAKICLLLNWEGSHPTLETTLPEEVTAAFGSGFEFQKIDAKVEHPTHNLYSLGRRKYLGDG